MNRHSRVTIERPSQFRRVSTTIRWAILALGMCVLGLHFSALTYLQGEALQASPIWVLYLAEAGLLLVALALFIAHSFLDIHERKVNETKAQDLAERLATTLESITDAFFTVDKKWRFTYVNREAERLLQRNRRELLRNNLWEAFPETLGSQFEEHYRRAMSSGSKVVFEAFFEPLNLWAAVNVYPAREGLAVYFQDITDRKRSEKARERIRELENSHELAELASQTKSEFLASMTHEIRTPINGIVGMVDVLHQTNLRGHQVEMVDIIRESSQSLLGIVDDILDFSKIEAGKLELHPSEFDPRALLRSICLLMDRMACNHDVELTLFADPGLPAWLLGDDLRLRQILLNLVSNAIKFSSNLGRKGRVRVEAVALKANSRGGSRGGVDRKLGDVEWRVRDNGVGMTSATLSRLFNPFVQADASTTRLYGGTGLGLSICHNLVELMGGDIKVTSQPSAGTEFRVRLPLPEVIGPGTLDHPVRGSELLSLSEHSILVCSEVSDKAETNDEDLTPIWSAYLTAAGAAASSDPVGKKGKSPWSLIVFDSGDSNPGQAELRSMLPQAVIDNARWLVIGRGYRRKVRRESDELFRIDANSLSQANFLEAVGVALGLITPEVPAGQGIDAVESHVSPSREQALAEGALMLVAEDNKTNQQVIQRQLGLLGYGADIANNGFEAFKRWQRNPHSYAAILTDLHMPVMDGYDFTEAVRQHEREQWGRRVIPIVALTANARGVENSRCLDIGMSDYLVKPVTLQELRKVLERWCPPQTKGESLLRSAPAVAKPVDEIGDGAYDDRTNDGETALDLNILRELIGGDETLLHEFVQIFRSSSEPLANKIRQSSQGRDWSAVADAAHSLKSSARSVGALPLGDLCMKLESVAHECSEQAARGKAGSIAHCEQDFRTTLNAFNIEWRRVQQALEEINIKSGI